MDVPLLSPHLCKVLLGSYFLSLLMQLLLIKPPLLFRGPVLSIFLFNFGETSLVVSSLLNLALQVLLGFDPPVLLEPILQKLGMVAQSRSTIHTKVLLLNFLLKL